MSGEVFGALDIDLGAASEAMMRKTAPDLVLALGPHFFPESGLATILHSILHPFIVEQLFGFSITST
jgi:hypothetical protein